ncbi:MAG: hypothetical protein GY777_29670 [Candidatus Brocadiaceae bacterium]|nr:hypothetical protein [Candidatus Brocadiaceae bacterium]
MNLVFKLIFLYIKCLWWFIILWSAFCVIALPTSIIYGQIVTWAAGEKKLHEEYPSQYPIVIGYASDTGGYVNGTGELLVKQRGYTQRSYILIPDVFSDWSTVSVNVYDDNSIEIQKDEFAFIVYLLFWGICLSFGIFYSIPKILSLFKRKSKTVEIT